MDLNPVMILLGRRLRLAVKCAFSKQCTGI